MNNKIKKSLKASLLDGIFASCMTGLTSDYIIPYALALKANNTQVGILSAFPSLFSSLVQVGSPELLDRVKSRKKIINTFVFFHLLMIIPILLIPYLFINLQPILFLTIFVTLFHSLGAFATPAWSSLISDYIPYKKRGKYFGWRNKVLGIVTLFSTLIAGFILYIFKHRILTGFATIFGLAFIFRAISLYFLTKMYEPPFKVKKEAYFSLFEFIKRIRESNFTRFVLFVAGFNFCVHLAAPFFPVFMLRDLGFNYLTYTIITITVVLAQIFTIDRWGRQADRVGNLKILKMTSLFIASIPIWWILNQAPIYLILVQIASGVAWSGFNLCTTNFIYDAAPPEKRARCVAYFNSSVGLALCLGAFLGGHLINLLPGLFGYKILSLFLLSSILRFSVLSLFLRKIREVRKVEEITSKEVFYGIVGFNQQHHCWKKKDKIVF